MRKALLLVGLLVGCVDDGPLATGFASDASVECNSCHGDEDSPVPPGAVRG